MRLRPALIALIGLCLAAGTAAAPLEHQRQSITIDGERYEALIPKGYILELLTIDLDGPRIITFHTNGDLFIGSKSGNVYRLPPPYTKPEVLVRMGGYPHSVAFRDGEILIARTDGLYHAPYLPGQNKLHSDNLSLLAPLSDSGGHNSRTVAVGPDGRVYLGLGISGNCSDEYLGSDYSFPDRRGGVLRLHQELGKAEWKTFASGLRNPVGFDWHPTSGVLYASNNGSDHLGYEQPPEYFSRLEAGSFHGMPWFQFDGKEVIRDSCLMSPPPRPKSEVTPPVAIFPARNAPMGVAFIPPGTMVPELEGDAVVALHGSWGTKPSGGFFGSRASRRPPKLVLVRFAKGRATGDVEDLVIGFQLENGDRWARPIGTAVGSDGALYFTSDGGNHALFRLRRNKNANSSIK